MTAMLHCLVGDVADALRAELPGGRLAANDEGDAALIALLIASGLLDEPRLMALLLRRADEERIGTAARARSGRREARVLHIKTIGPNFFLIYRSSKNYRNNSKKNTESIA